ncbi:hypothetical protein BpHYR1_036538 [Brachionus plicatilis]|uniref:Uncharacterized protein n=1 Tax=Brachionus plicatilis TaxID=10195 RepID=A0A3M7T9U4_BRAPC|nr:hypothetical protein BpHYR1_036538 [Brachionus plicatilis]
MLSFTLKKNAFLANYFIHEVGQKYPNGFFLTHLGIFKLVGSKMTQSWLYEGSVRGCKIIILIKIRKT